MNVCPPRGQNAKFGALEHEIGARGQNGEFLLGRGGYARAARHAVGDILNFCEVKMTITLLSRKKDEETGQTWYQKLLIFDPVSIEYSYCLSNEAPKQVETLNVYIRTKLDETYNIKVKNISTSVLKHFVEDAAKGGNIILAGEVSEGLDF